MPVVLELPTSGLKIAVIDRAHFFLASQSDNKIDLRSVNVGFGEASMTINRIISLHLSLRTW